MAHSLNVESVRPPLVHTFNPAVGEQRILRSAITQSSLVTHPDPSLFEQGYLYPNSPRPEQYTKGEQAFQPKVVTSTTYPRDNGVMSTRLYADRA